MSSLDKKADTYLDLCKDFMISEFGETAVLDRAAGSKIMTVRPAPRDGSPVRCFDMGERVWEEMTEDFETGVVIVHDGRVSVSYPCQDVEHGGMNFQVGHPREVAELFHLLVNPASCITPNEECAWGRRKLGDIAGFQILILDGNNWRIMDQANTPASAPADFLEKVFFSVVQDWDKLAMQKTLPARELVADCSDIVKTLPQATDQLKSGYLLTPMAGVYSPVDQIANGPAANPTFLDLLIVPKGGETSCLYLREFLVRDKAMGKAIRDAFSSATSLATLLANLAAVELYMPVKRPHQIRVAAEHILIREWFRSITECLVESRGCYPVQGEQQWHLAYAMRLMIGRNED
jgi:hypothetical protein